MKSVNYSAFFKHVRMNGFILVLNAFKFRCVLCVYIHSEHVTLNETILQYFSVTCVPQRGIGTLLAEHVRFRP